MAEKNAFHSSFWVKLLRFVAYASIICGCLFSLIIGCIFIFRADPANRAAGILVGIAVIVIGSVASLLGSAGIMVFLDMASDLRAIRGQVESSKKA